MTIKTLSVYVVKLILAGAAFAFGTMLGGMVSTLLGLTLPPPPQGADMSAVSTYTMLTTPLLALGLALVASKVAGSLPLRALVLAFFMWVAYGLNTQLEATIVSTYAAGFWFATVMYAVASLLFGAAVAFLFPPAVQNESVQGVLRAFWARHSAASWAWRLAVSAVVFMPIYFGFGLMVVPFTADYYRQSMFGLVMPTLETLLPILFLRSILFLLACLPILALWQDTNRALFWRLGTALFFLVGFVIMLYATWLPIYVRLPHTLEILADEFVYAGALVWLLGARQSVTSGMSRLIEHRGLG